MELYLVGATAAVLTSALWTVNAVLFTSAGRKIGAISVNAWRILFALILLWATHFILVGRLFPEGTQEQWFWIGLSGIVGLGIGDFGLFSSFVIIGTRRAVLVMSLSAIFATIAAFFLFDEILTIVAFMGVAITLSGVIVVLLESEDKSNERRLTKKQKIKGISLAMVGAIGQGLGLAFLKKGMLLYPETTALGDVLSLAVASTLMRMMLGALFVWLVIVLWGKLPDIKKALKKRRSMRMVYAGAVIGPFIGVTLSTIAAYLVAVGVAQTLMSLMPVMIIPVVWYTYKQRTSWRGIVGACVAVVGVGMLFLV
ncbi:MAG: DMT family transporter [Thermoplasmata archaeon]|nr:DMT family transporter [Thermoplasmata archaeon]